MCAQTLEGREAEVDKTLKHIPEKETTTCWLRSLHLQRQPTNLHTDMRRIQTHPNLFVKPLATQAVATQPHQLDRRGRYLQEAVAANEVEARVLPVHPTYGGRVCHTEEDRPRHALAMQHPCEPDALAQQQAHVERETGVRHRRR